MKISGETNKHVIKNTPTQLKRIHAAGFNAWRCFNFPITFRTRVKGKSFRRYKFI